MHQAWTVELEPAFPCPHATCKSAMTTLVPRRPYSQEELDKLYPKDLELRLVQVLLRHGERAPVSVRFQNVRVGSMWRLQVKS